MFFLLSYRRYPRVQPLKGAQHAPAGLSYVHTPVNMTEASTFQCRFDASLGGLSCLGQRPARGMNVLLPLWSRHSFGARVNKWPCARLLLVCLKGPRVHCHIYQQWNEPRHVRRCGDFPLEGLKLVQKRRVRVSAIRLYRVDVSRWRSSPDITQQYIRHKYVQGLRALVKL